MKFVSFNAYTSRFASVGIAALVLLAGCRSATNPPSQNQGQQSSKPPEPANTTAKVYPATVPPTRKQVLRMLLEIQDVTLASSPSCAGVGTEPTDATIGDYISGFLAEQDSNKGGNSIEVTSTDEQGADQAHAWRSTVTIRHLDGDDRWGWGVSFLLRPGDHSVVRNSVRCVGAG